MSWTIDDARESIRQKAIDDGYEIDEEEELDDLPREPLFLGTGGCPHYHLMPGVTPKGCSYCGGAE